MDRWEYVTIAFQSDDDWNCKTFNQQLNAYGTQGWELVSCFCTESPVNRSVMSLTSGGTAAVFAVLKRKTQ